MSRRSVSAPIYASSACSPEPRDARVAAHDLSTYPIDVRPRIVLWERQGVLALILDTCAAWHASVDEVLAPGRGSSRVAHARQAVYAALRSVAHQGRPVYSYHDIAAMLNRDHSSVIEGIAAHNSRKAA